MFAAARALTATSPRPRSQEVMAIMFTASGMVFAVRGAVFALVPQIANPTPFEVHPFTTVSYILFFIIAIALPFGLLLMCNERHLEARDLAERRLLRAATVDSLTQVHNRAAVTAHLCDALAPRVRLALADPIFPPSVGAQPAVRRYRSRDSSVLDRCSLPPTNLLIDFLISDGAVLPCASLPVHHSWTVSSTTKGGG
jgi:hypothetical protein